jgi:ATP-dependent DNA helicase RecG
VSGSSAISGFLEHIIPHAEPLSWLKKQRLIFDEKPTVAGVLLFSDEPQIDLPKASIKIYRYKTSDDEGSRATLETDPMTIEGSAYRQIYDAVEKVTEIAESIPIVGTSGLEKIEYPDVAIHEIVTNAVLHRDYSINDDVHIRIFDNRIEVESPGVLPGHVTEKNILDERFARNPKIVRLINKHRNPPNKDVGEGLNTSFQAMRELKLREPDIQQRDNSVRVILKHERLGSNEELIVNYLKENSEINNTIARGLCAVGDANKMKRIFQGMMKSAIIERIPGRAQSKAAYRRGKNFPK